MHCNRGNGQEPFGTYPTVKEALHVYVTVKTEYVMEVAKTYDAEIQAGLKRFCDRLWSEYASF